MQLSAAVAQFQCQRQVTYGQRGTWNSFPVQTHRPHSSNLWVLEISAFSKQNFLIHQIAIPVFNIGHVRFTPQSTYRANYFFDSHAYGM